MKKIKINGLGCSLADYVYGNVDFSSIVFKKYMSRKKGDGGLAPGALVFTEDIERFAGEKFEDIRRKIVRDVEPDTFNVGGPAIVAMINAAQLTHDENVDVSFYGHVGDDDIGAQILELLKKTPLNTDNYVRTPCSSPFTDVLSDPHFNDGQGERMFVNNLGAAQKFSPLDLNAAFFDADIVLFGATALVPDIHVHLNSLLKKSKTRGAVTVVTTVYDFPNEKKNPHARWPVGDTDETFANIDLLIMDYEEGLRISGTKSMTDAILFFKERGVSTCVITNGAGDVHFFSDGRLFGESQGSLPVSRAVGKELKQYPERKGDTTGCGDNFAGGVIASLARQLRIKSKGELDVIKALSWGMVSGGFACFYYGGAYFEKAVGEKKMNIKKYYNDYINQIAHRKEK